MKAALNPLRQAWAWLACLFTMPPPNPRPIALLAPNPRAGEPGEQAYIVMPADTHPDIAFLAGAFEVYDHPAPSDNPIPHHP